MQTLVIADVEQRRAVGIERYGQGLKPHDGRDNLRDLYEELLDAAIYCRKQIYERDASKSAQAPTREQLQSIEWAAEWRYDHDWTYPSCPACEGLKPHDDPDHGKRGPVGHGHTDDCWLAVALEILAPGRYQALWSTEPSEDAAPQEPAND